MIGAGSTGAAVAHDLALRGFRVTVVERGEVASGTTGRNHALLHSGARYVVRDPEAAAECARENRILRRIAAGVVEPVGGWFVGLDEADRDYLPRFLAGCEAAGVSAEPVDPAEALHQEPLLNPRLVAAVRVHDAVFDPYRLVASLLATAQANGAAVRTHCRVVGVLRDGPALVGVEVIDDVEGTRERIEADLVVNAAGPWAHRVAALAGVRVPLVPSAGVMVALEGRLTRSVVNRLRLPGDGDIVVPQRLTTLVGTTSWITEELDPVPVPWSHVETLIREGSRLIPAIASQPVKAVFASARPLVAGNLEAEGREISRGFQIFDHGREGAPGLITVAGGKTTTSRLMAETLGDRVCEQFGRTIPCRTAEVPLRPYYELWTGRRRDDPGRHPGAASGRRARSWWG